MNLSTATALVDRRGDVRVVVASERRHRTGSADPHGARCGVQDGTAFVTLRTRLVIGLALVSVVLGLVVLLVPRAVERAQIRQLDRQLVSVSPRATREVHGTGGGSVHMRP